MRAMRRMWTVLALALLVGAVGVPAEAAGTNLLVNGDFEGTGSGSLAGWSVEREPLAGDGRRRRLRGQGAYGGSGSTYSIVATAKVVTSGTAGTCTLADGGSTRRQGSRSA